MQEAPLFTSGQICIHTMQRRLLLAKFVTNKSEGQLCLWQCFIILQNLPDPLGKSISLAKNNYELYEDDSICKISHWQITLPV